MAPRRTHLHVVVDHRDDGTKEINRAWAQDEVENADTSRGLGPAHNVTPATLADILPETADLLAQISARIDERDEALKAKAAAEGEARAAAQRVAELEARLAELVEAPDVVKTYMSDLWRRATDAEGVAIEAIVASLPARLRGLLNSVTYLDHADEQFPAIVAALTQAFGEARAAQLLAPSG